MSIKQEPGTVTENVTEVEHDSSDNRDGKTVNKNSLLPEEDSALPKSIKSNGLWLKPDIRDEVSTGTLGDSSSQKCSSQTGDQTEMESDYNDKNVMINNTDCLPHVKTECLHEEDGPVLNLMKSREQSSNISTPDIREHINIADAYSSQESCCDNSDPLQRTKTMGNSLQTSYTYVTGRHCENQVKKRKCRENDVELKRSSLHHIIASKIACKLEKQKESQTAPGNSLVNDIDEHQSSEQRDSPAGKRNACNQGEYACGELLKLKQSKRKHIGTKQFSCDYCDYTCSHSSHFKVHQRKHTGDKPYSCDVCDFTCAQSSSLKRHKQRHTGEKPYSCDLCDYTCAQSSHLKEHKQKHTGEEPYSCDLCDYTCAQSSSLRVHIRKHTGEKPYSCEFCDYTCAQSSHLKVHERKHTGERPYSCDLCDFTCAQSSHLKAHKRTHTGEKPYSCDLCDFTCAQSSSLIAHKVKHTGNKPCS